MHRTISSQEDKDKYNYCKRVVKDTLPGETNSKKILKYSYAKDFIKHPELLHYSAYNFMVKL